MRLRADINLISKQHYELGRCLSHNPDYKSTNSGLYCFYNHCDATTIGKRLLL